MKVMVMIGVKNGCRGECDGDGDVNLVWRGWRLVKQDSGSMVVVTRFHQYRF